MKRKLILASTSETRIKILRSTGVNFQAVASNFEEEKLVSTSAYELSLLRAKAKARAIVSQFPDSVIIGADQVLESQGRLFDKASSETEACEHLRFLSNHEHQLVNGICVLEIGNGKVLREKSWNDTARMFMHALKDSEIAKYISLGEWRGCVGCYRFEGAGVNLFRDVIGSSDSILGLPRLSLLAVLRDFGVGFF